MSSILEDLTQGFSSDYAKNPNEQTDGGRKGLAPSEVGFIQTAVNQTTVDYDAHSPQRYNLTGRDLGYIASEQTPENYDAHSQNLLLGELKDLIPVKREKGRNG